MTSRSSTRRPSSKRRSGGRRRGKPARGPAGQPARGLGWVEWILVGVAAVGLVVLWWAWTSDSSPPEGAAFVGGHLHSIVVDPTQPDVVYVGGHDAVSRSVDGGATWERVDSLDGADAMGWGFTDDAVLVSGHPGLTVSPAGIASFERRNDGLPDTDLHALGAGGGTVYAAGPRAGVIASTDGGATWQTRTTTVGQSFFGRILVDDDATTLIASDAQSGPMRSSDGGRTWTTMGGPASVWLTITNDDTTIASGPQGAYRYQDGDAVWEAIAIPDGAQLVEADPHTPGGLFAAGLSDSTVDVWVSTDDGRTWDRT